MADALRISLDIQSDEWGAALDRLVASLQVATANASMDAAEHISAITKAKLMERQHGPLTFSPSPGGSPPAMVSGDLALSIDTGRYGATGAMVGPTAGFGRSGDYARIQELGGPMDGQMRFRKAFEGAGPNLYMFPDGSRYRWHDTHVYRTFELTHVDLEPRPYLRPATEEAVDDGEVRDIYISWWARAIREAT